MQQWGPILAQSNGLVIVESAVTKPLYRYYVGKGNHPTVVLHCLKARWWWTPNGKDSDTKPHFVWSQGIQKDYLRTFPKNDAFSLPEISELNVEMEGETLGFNLIQDSKSFTVLQSTAVYESYNLLLHNRLERNFHLTNKKALFINLKEYYESLGQDPFTVIPLTFHITGNLQTYNFQQFTKAFESGRKRPRGKNMWIVKPGENSNQGCDIFVTSNMDKIKDALRFQTCPKTGKKRTYIIQKYIERPLLIYRRKFDIR